MNMKINMNVIVLAAGVGRRLAPYTETRPKCLMEIDDHTLLERHVVHSERLGASSLTIVVGHKKEMIEREIAGLGLSLPVRVVFNEEYRKGSILSLRAGLRAVDGDVIFMDADVLYHADVLGRLFATERASCLLLDAGAHESGEEMMVGVKSDRAQVIARRVGHLGPFDVVGESVGFFRVAREHVAHLHQSIDETLSEVGENVEYEDALNRFFSRVPVGIERVDDLPWTEIDFAEDLERARNEVARSLPPLYGEARQRGAEGGRNHR